MTKFRVFVFIVAGYISNVAISAPLEDLFIHPVGGSGSGVSGRLFEQMDDFVIPSGQTWSITSIISAGFGTINMDVGIKFYTSSSGAFSACSRTAKNISTNPMEFELPTVCTLSSGTYWYAVRTFSSGVSLQNNTTQTISGSESRIRDTFVNFCGSSFVPFSDCFTGSNDLNFTIRGCMGTVCDIPSITLLESGGSTDVDEGDVATTDSYTLVLDAIPAPGEVVTITPSFDAINGVTVSPASAIFDTTDWDMPVTMTVTAVDDTLPEASPHTSTITHATSSNNANYDAFPVDSVIVNILDNNDEIMFVDGFEEPPPP